MIQEHLFVFIAGGETKTDAIIVWGSAVYCNDQKPVDSCDVYVKVGCLLGGGGKFGK